MEDGTDFSTTLRSFMARALRSNSDLARLTSISVSTIEKWTAGLVRRPRLVADVLIVARVLALDQREVVALLRAAGHPPLAQLWAQAHQLSDSRLIELLAGWDGAARPLPPSDPAGAAARTAPTSSVAKRYQSRPPVADLVGRAQEIDQVVTRLRTALAQGDGAIISGVQGMGGIGKTELAYAVAHRLREAFPDGQIVLTLRGSSTASLTPEQALQTVIHAFTPDAQLPESLAALEQHYRTVLHGQQVLIIADDARDAAQVRALIPPAGCALLITSRQRFTLPCLTQIHLEALRPADADVLLCQICARLTTTEARTIARACGYLPLALRVSGGILANSPALAVPTYIQQLADVRQRLSALRDPDDTHMDVAASLAFSYMLLHGEAQQVFRQLGVMVADFATDLAQAVAGAPTGVEVETILHHLLRRNLVMYDDERARWRLHDLMRDLAWHYLDAAGELETAMWRYARVAVRLAEETQEQYLAGGDAALAALARFDAEQPHIDAARGWAALHAGIPDGDRLLLEDAAATYQIGDLRYDARRERVPLWERALAAAQRLGDRHGEGQTLNNLGNAYVDLGDWARAIACYEQRLIIARALGDRRGEGMTLGNLGIAYAELGDAERAIHYFEQDLAIARALGDRRGEGQALSNLGNAYMTLGEVERAIACYEQRLIIARALGDQRGEGIALSNLGGAYVELGNAGCAIQSCEMACAIACAIGDRSLEGCALSFLARAHAHQGNSMHAATTFAQALVLLRAVGDRVGEVQCQWYYGMFLAHQGDRELALPLLRATVAYKQEIGHAQATEHAALLACLEASKELTA